MYYEPAIATLTMSRYLITAYSEALTKATGVEWFNLTRAKLRVINRRDRALILLKQGR